MKTCKVCNIEKHLNEFYTNGKTTKGTVKYKSECKTCNKADIKARRANAIDSILKELGMTLQCVLCGYKRNRAALCFHHLDDESKDFTISGNTMVSREKLKQELEKCTVLCHNCHMEIHYPHKNMDN